MTKRSTKPPDPKSHCAHLDQLYSEASKAKRMSQIYFEVRTTFANKCSSPGAVKEKHARAEAWGHFKSEFEQWLNRLPPKLRSCDQDLTNRYFFNMIHELTFADAEEIRKREGERGREGEQDGKN